MTDTTEGLPGAAPEPTSSEALPTELATASPAPEERHVLAQPAGEPHQATDGHRPQIGDTRPAPPGSSVALTNGAATSGSGNSGSGNSGSGNSGSGRSRNRNRGGSGRGPRPAPEAAPTITAEGFDVFGGVVTSAPIDSADDGADSAEATSSTPSRRSRSRRRGGRERRGRSTGRYMVCVHVAEGATQIAVLEGRALVDHYVSRAANDTTQIDGNIYRGRIQNVLPGMEAAFVDIGTPKNAVLYRGDVHWDTEDLESGAKQQNVRIEEVLRAGQTILCQVTKNPIGAKGARLTQEVSLPGRFAVLVPNSSAFGISKRLGDNERRRLRKIIDDVRPQGHGLIVRTAAEGATADELRRDIASLLEQWHSIDTESKRSDTPGLLYREPQLAVRILREELNQDYRGVIIDDKTLYNQMRDYVSRISPDLAERVEYFDTEIEPLSLFERHHVHEQLHKALDRKVWLPSGGSLIIEHTEALTVIDVNTGKNVGKTNLEETVFKNNLEAAEEVARQLRLRDIGGIIVIDFIDMEIRENRDKVAAALRNALALDKTRTQVFDISELGLVEMTRKRVSEGLLESMSHTCSLCAGRGVLLDDLDA